MTCLDWILQLSSSKCLTKVVMAIWTKMNKSWCSLASRKRCTFWLKNSAMSKNMLYIKTSWKKFDFWKQTFVSFKMSWDPTFSQSNWLSILRLEMRSFKSSLEIGSSTLKNTNKNVWLKLKSLSTIMKIKCKYLMKSWTVLLKTLRSNQKLPSKKCKWMRSS